MFNLTPSKKIFLLLITGLIIALISWVIINQENEAPEIETMPLVEEDLENEQRREEALGQINEQIKRINLILLEDWGALEEILIAEGIEFSEADFLTMQTDLIDFLENQMGLELVAGKELSEEQKEIIRDFILEGRN